MTSIAKTPCVLLMALGVVQGGCAQNGEVTDRETDIDSADFALQKDEPLPAEVVGANKQEQGYSQTILSGGPGYTLMHVAGIVPGSGTSYSKPIYVVNDSEGIANAPLPDDIRTDLLYDLVPEDAVYSLDVGVLDQIVQSEQLGVLTPELAAIAEPDDPEDPPPDPAPDPTPSPIPGDSLGLRASVAPRDAWFGKCRNQVQVFTKNVTLNSSFSTTASLGGGFTGTLSTGGGVTGSATVDVTIEKRRFRLLGFCIPYGIRFKSAAAQGSAQVSPSASLNGSVNAKWSWEKRVAKPTVASVHLMIGPIPVYIPISLPIHVGLEMDATLTGALALNTSQGASGSFNYTCTLKGCTGTSTFSTLASASPTITGSIALRAKPALWAQVAVRAALYDDDFAYAQAGIRPYVRGDLWEYHGNTCGDANGDGTNETIDARLFDADWQAFVTGEASFFGNTKKWDDLWHSSTYHIGFWDLLGSNAFSPMLQGSSAPTAGTSQNYSAQMRSCWPYDDAVNYRMAWGDATTSSASGAAHAVTNMSHTWNAPGSYTLGLTAQSDAHGRSFSGTTSRNVQTQVAPPAQTSRHIALGDMNGDGKADVFCADGSNWRVSYGGTSLLVPLKFSAAQLPNIALADINGDGKADVFHTTPSGYAGPGWYVSYGGTTNWKYLNTSATMLPNVALGDMNGDSKADVFYPTPNAPAGPGWLVSYGGTSVWNFLNSSAATLANVALGDMNGDGKTDVFHTSTASGAGRWYVSYGGTTGWNLLNTSDAMLPNVALGDLNGDHKADVFFTTPSGYAGSGWYVSYGGTSGWNFLKSSTAMLPDVMLGDMNGDGKTDVFYASASGPAGSGWYVSYGGTSALTKLQTITGTCLR